LGGGAGDNMHSRNVLASVIAAGSAVEWKGETVSLLRLDKRSLSGGV
jgi:hypothetical protein